jgi:hypothetical protein
LLAYQALNGRFSPSPRRAEDDVVVTARPAGPPVSEHGFFFWTPLSALALAGLLILALSPRRDGDPSADADRRRIPFCLLIMLVATVYVTGSVDSWTAAGAFGQRRFVNLTPLLTVGLAALFARVGKIGTRREARTPVYALLAPAALCVWWNLALIAQFGAHMMDRQRLELARNARTAFVTLPTMGPRLVYRYLFDRQSFYKPEPPAQ